MALSGLIRIAKQHHELRANIPKKETRLQQGMRMIWHWPSWVRQVRELWPSVETPKTPPSQRPLRRTSMTVTFFCFNFFVFNRPCLLNLTFSSLIKSITKTAFDQLKNLSRMKGFISRTDQEKLTILLPSSSVDVTIL